MGCLKKKTGGSELRFFRTTSIVCGTEPKHVVSPLPLLENSSIHEALKALSLLAYSNTKTNLFLLTMCSIPLTQIPFISLFQRPWFFTSVRLDTGKTSSLVFPKLWLFWVYLPFSAGCACPSTQQRTQELQGNGSSSSGVTQCGAKWRIHVPPAARLGVLCSWQCCKTRLLTAVQTKQHFRPQPFRGPTAADTLGRGKQLELRSKGKRSWTSKWRQTKQERRKKERN